MVTIKAGRLRKSNMFCIPIDDSVICNIVDSMVLAECAVALWLHFVGNGQVPIHREVSL